MNAWGIGVEARVELRPREAWGVEIQSTIKLPIKRRGFGG